MIFRSILFLHRYLAVALGLLMTLWCLSGFVMMYQGMPELRSEDRLRGLDPLNLAGCCNLDVLPSDVEPVAGFRIEMQNGEPVLRGQGGGGFGAGRRDSSLSPTTVLTTGEPLAELTEDQVLAVAAGHARGLGIQGTPRSLGIVDIDQWTLQSARRNRPTHHVAFDDPAATEVYINGSTGEIFLDTDRRERTLAWLGAIPHWLYPTALRQNGPLWIQIVIWTSVIGTFLAATGLYVGVSRLKRRKKDGKLTSPFRGWWYWHHMLGLAFGILTLTWVFSGLLTVNPWGVLESRGGGELHAQITGTSTWGDARRFLEAAQTKLDTGRYVQFQASTFDNRLYVMATRIDGTRERLDADGNPAEISRTAVEAVIARLPTLSSELMDEEDSYYYGHKNRADLPVYRVTLDDPERTLLYINPETGALRFVDSNARWSRWIRRGLHGLDFSGLRTRPVWDIVVILLLAGVTAVCVTGTWMAFKRIKFDWQRMKAPTGRADYGTAPEIPR